MNKAATQLTRLFACMSAATLIGCGGGSAETNTNTDHIDPTQPVSDWVMVWNDEFDGDKIDASKWTHEVNCDGGGNAEKQCYTDSPKNSFVADGILNIVALPSADTALPYTSARLNTKYKGDFKYGRFEMRAKMPSGQGSWPAFWMLPTDDVYGGWPKSGEIDIMEAVNLKAADADGNPEAHIYGTLHYGLAWNDKGRTGQPYLLPDNANPADDFHTYALEWQEGEMRWYVDDYLYATQRQSELRYNSKDEVVGLIHKGWYTEYHDPNTGEVITRWDSAPYDQKFHMLLNVAVGGDWPENVNETGVDAEAFANGQTMAIDYVRVYECSIDPDTGRGCDTVRAGYDQFASEEMPNGALLEGDAPTPPPPPVPKPLTIFGDTLNPDWVIWDCCGGSNPGIVTEAGRGDVARFVVGGSPTVNGFTNREEFGGGVNPYDGSGLLDIDGYLRFEMKVVSLPNNAAAPWLLKVESEGAGTFAEVNLNTSIEGLDPVAGEWQTFTFPIADLAAAGLDPSAIDVVMIFPAWGSGEGAEYLVDDLEITAEGLGTAPSLTIFTDGENLDWPMWDCCGGTIPTEEMDDEAHGVVAEFQIGASPAVLGFNTRPDIGGGDKPFDASAILGKGVIQFDMKAVSLPNNASAEWKLKVESDNAASAVEVDLNTSLEGQNPAAGEWQTYTFPLADLNAKGLDVSAIDVIMIFPAWGSGEGAVYRVDNVKIYDPEAGTLPVFIDTDTAFAAGHYAASGDIAIEDIDLGGARGIVKQFTFNSDQSLLFFQSEEGTTTDVSAYDSINFDVKVVTDNGAPGFIFKMDCVHPCSTGDYPIDKPVEGEWTSYSLKLADLVAHPGSTLDIYGVNTPLVLMPTWGNQNGFVIQVDNVRFK